MKGLLKYLPPFAPDPSGACAVLYALGGILVICDAGGCTGNICGFDEPRWFREKSAIFSAGLRDMDAVMGRDDRLVAKLKSAAETINASFAAVIGTPVPAVIGTDYHALARMIETQVGLPALCVETTGTRLYDEGMEEALYRLFRQFATEALPVKPATVNVLGMTPLDFSLPGDQAQLAAVLHHQGYETIRWIGCGDGLDGARRASEAEKNLVLSPAGLKTARYLEQTFGTPFTAECPFLWKSLLPPPPVWSGKKVLILHQQFIANALRRALLRLAPAAQVDVASWFLLDQAHREAEDFSLSEEEDLMRRVAKGGYEVIFADRLFRRALKGYGGIFIDFPHFAVSGQRRDLP